MAFTWKDKKDMFKGEGIYFLTFNVKNRIPLLGKLRKLDFPDKDGHTACVDGYELGNAVYREFSKLQSMYDGLQVIAKQIMPNHFHAVVWCHKEFAGQSIKMVARGFSQACSRIARELYQQGRLTGAIDNGRLDRPDMNNTTGLESASEGTTGLESASEGTTGLESASEGSQGTMVSVSAQSNCAFDELSRTANSPYYCGNGANTLFETPYIRTLSHRGQLDRMVKYTHNNPDNLQRVKDNPQYYVIRRCREYAGLKFDCMGKERLLDYPDKNEVDLSRSLTQEQIDAEVAEAMRLADSGCVTYTAAMNDGEKAVAKAVRAAEHPLVVMMLGGFPPEGSEQAKYYHPNGVYHKACGKGLLFLMAPYPENYDNPRLIELTEQELARKAAEKGKRYWGMPHTQTRWRMIAGNMMLKMITGEESHYIRGAQNYSRNEDW